MPRARPKKLSHRLVIFAAGLVIALLAVAASPTISLAHAKPISSTPSPNQNLSAAPTSVTITFGQSVKPSGSDIIIYDKTGQKVSTGPAVADPNNLKKMTVAMKGNDSEAYLVVWHTVSAEDDEAAIGSFTFGVNAKADDLPEASGSGSEGVTPGFAALIGVLGLGLGAAGAYAVMRRQQPVA